MAGKEDESNIFLRLLQNQVRNYQSKPRDKKKESKMKKKRAPPPPSPTPDYLQEEPKSLKPKEKPSLLSKSISSLVTEGKTEDKVRLEKKISGINLLPVVENGDCCNIMISGSSLELRGSQTTPVPDYEVDPVISEAQLSERDVWGNVERYRSVTPPD